MDRNNLAIIKKAQQGNQEAYEQLYELYYKQAYHQALKLCKNETDAKDIAQDALLQVYQSLPQLRDLQFFNGWLARIVHSKCIKLFSHNRDALYDPELLPKSALPEKRIDHLPNKYTDDMTDKEIVHTLLQKLSTKQQEIMELFYFQQYSLKEIEAKLQIPNGTIKSRIFEAKKSLKVIIKNFEEKEGRKLSFHLDQVAPSLFMAFIAKLSSAKLFQNSQAMNIMGVVATTSCVAISTVAIAQSYQVITNTQETAPIVVKETLKPETINFTPIQYQTKQITTPKAAYFTLKKQAVDDEELSKLPPQQIKDLAPIVSSLEQDKTFYLENLVNNNWLTTYKSLK